MTVYHSEQAAGLLHGHPGTLSEAGEPMVPMTGGNLTEAATRRGADPRSPRPAPAGLLDEDHLYDLARQAVSDRAALQLIEHQADAYRRAATVAARNGHLASQARRARRLLAMAVLAADLVERVEQVRSRPERTPQ